MHKVTRHSTVSSALACLLVLALCIVSAWFYFAWDIAGPLRRWAVLGLVAALVCPLLVLLLLPPRRVDVFGARSEVRKAIARERAARSRPAGYDHDDAATIGGAHVASSGWSAGGDGLNVERYGAYPEADSITKYT